MLQTKNEWVDALGKLEDISTYRGKQLKALVLGAGFKQHSEMLRDALQGQVGVVKEGVRDQVLHRPQTKSLRRSLLESAFRCILTTVLFQALNTGKYHRNCLCRCSGTAAT